MRYPFAIKAYAASSFKISYWDAWRASLPSSADDDVSFEGLAKVVCRGETLAPVTSGVEQSFSKVQAILGSNKLNSASETEDMSVSLFVLRFTPADIHDIATRAQNIWRRAFSKHSRLHVKQRSDANVHGLPSRSKSDSSGSSSGLLTERKFLMRMRDEIQEQAPAGSSSVLDHAQPELWTDGHEAELQFQITKQKKRRVEAIMGSPNINFVV
jgi:hypothetical protein